MAIPAHPARPVALVTGASRRLGRAIALALAHDGWDLVVHYGSSEEAANRCVAEVQEIGGRALALHADLDQHGDLKSLLPRSAEHLGEVQCIVNNASRFDYDAIDSFDGGFLEAQMRTNVTAPLVLAQELHRRRVEHKAEPASAVVVNLLDQKLFNLNPDFLSYTLTKAALHAATSMLAQALAPFVRVVGIAPGITLPSADQSAEEFAKAHQATPLGQSSTPDDIAQAVCYLARARAVTGTTLLVDGGQHLLASSRDVMFLAR